MARAARPAWHHDRMMEARADVAAARLRRCRIPALAVVVAVVVLCDLLQVAQAWENVAVAAFTVLFWYLPGIETVVRNFRAGYARAADGVDERATK